MVPKILKAVCLFLLASSRLSAEDLFDLARPALRVYGMEDGLPSGTIYCFAKDTKGRLWAGTVDGAAYYTGHGWVPVRLPKESNSQYVRSILASRDGSLWFAIQDGGLWRLENDHWTHFQVGRDIPSEHVFSLAETQDAQGRLTRWVGTSDRGIATFSGDQWRTWGPKDGLPGGTVWRIREIQALDGSRQVWAATERGPCRFDGTKWHVLGPQDGFPGGNTNDILDVQETDGSRSIWFSGWSLGLARWDKQGWTQFAAGQGFPAHFPTSSLSLTKDPEGRPLIWIGTLNQGLWWFKEGRWLAVGRSRGFQTMGILSLLPVPEGKPTLLIGTRGGGVASLDLGGWRTLDETLGLPGMEVTSFTETAGSPFGEAFWVGTTSGLACFRAGRPAEHVNAKAFPTDYITALLATENALWVGTLNGLVRKNAKGWQRVDADGLLPDGMVISLLETRSRHGLQTLWVGTPKGLYQFQGGRWRQLTTRDGLPQDYVSALCAVPGTDGEPVLWVGTRGGGVCRFEGGTWTTFGEAAGMSNGNIYALHATSDPNGHPWLWAGTLGGGLARLDLQTPGRWELFTRDTLPGLSSNYVQRIEEDRQGRLYLSTSAGVVRIHLDSPLGHPRPSRVDTFTLGDGLPSQNGNLGASFVDSHGRIWIGTSRGATILDPALETFPPEPPLPVLERASVADPDRIITSGQRLGFRDNHFRFEFSLPVFHRKEDTLYRTQLVGLETTARPWQREAWREFATLPPGSYVLRVWGQTFAGKVAGPIEFPFVVAPAPWAHPLAYLLYALSAVMTVLGLLRLRTRVLQERTVALGSAVQARTQELAEANEALQNLIVTDPLTGLNNRRYVDATMGDVVARTLRRYTSEAMVPGSLQNLNRDLVFLMVDLDHFKSVNDRHGHRAGDLVLKQAAEVLRNAVREVDRVVRWGGEEFLVIAQDVNLDEATLLAERIRAAVEAHPFEIDLERPLHRTCSVGLACFPLLQQDPGCFSWEQVLNMADQCLYEAKEQGRNQWVAIIPLREVEPTLSIRPSTMTAREAARMGLVARKTGPSPL